MNNTLSRISLSCLIMLLFLTVYLLSLYEAPVNQDFASQSEPAAKAMQKAQANIRKYDYLMEDLKIISEETAKEEVISDRLSSYYILDEGIIVLYFSEEDSEYLAELLPSILELTPKLETMSSVLKGKCVIQPNPFEWPLPLQDSLVNSTHDLVDYEIGSKLPHGSAIAILSWESKCLLYAGYGDYAGRMK